MASFESINYSLRTNKNIERKLIFDTINSLSGLFGIPNYQYIGFGSIWFIDYLVAHRKLAINEMLSFERDPYGFSRANFNKPFKCIKVEKGESNKLIPNLDLSDRPIFAWLDYDSYLSSSSVLDDIELLCNKALSGSIILVTVNASPMQINGHMISTSEIIETLNEIFDTADLPEEDIVNIIQNYIAEIGISPSDRKRSALDQIAGDLVPTNLADEDLSKRNLPNVFAQILFNKFTHAINISGRGERFYPLFNYYYKDNAPMITVGGMVANTDDAKKISKSQIRKKRHVTGEKQFFINAPTLTIKEKVSLDQLLPDATSFGYRTVKKELNVEFKPKHLAEYEQLYLYYPVFGEIEV